MRHSLSILSVLLLALCHTSGAFVPRAVPSHNAATDGFGLQLRSSLVVKSRTVKPTVGSSTLAMASKSDGVDDESGPSWSFNPLFASLWISFVAFAVLGPGDFGSSSAMINAYIENPSDPGFSEGFQLIFNFLGLMPIIIACISVPQASKLGLPPLAFLLSSFAMGYGGVGKCCNCCFQRHLLFCAAKLIPQFLFNHSSITNRL